MSDFNKFPILRLQLEDCAYHVQQHMASHHNEIEKLIEIAFKEEIAKAPMSIAEHVTTYCKMAVQKEVEAYFNYGAGRKAVEKCIHESLKPLTDFLNKQTTERNIL